MAYTHAPKYANGVGRTLTGINSSTAGSRFEFVGCNRIPKSLPTCPFHCTGKIEDDEGRRTRHCAIVPTLIAEFRHGQMALPRPRRVALALKTRPTVGAGGPPGPPG
jgi:hypothetical protein